MTRDYTNDQIRTLQDNIRANLPPGAGGALLDILDKVKAGVPMTADQVSAIIRLGEQQASQMVPGLSEKGGNVLQHSNSMIEQTSNYLLGLQTARNFLETSARAPDTLMMNAGTMNVLTQLANGYDDPIGWEEGYDDWGFDDLDFSSYLEDHAFDFGFDDIFSDGYSYEMPLEMLLDEHITPNEFFGLQGNEDDISRMVADYGRNMKLDLGDIDLVNGPGVQASAPSNEGLEFGAKPSGVSGPTMKLPGQDV